MSESRPPVSAGKSIWKGKEKATVQDFDDLNPIITYRHILQQNLGVRDPLRVVALCDSDAFYAACEMVRLGVKDKPLVVLQWEGIIAVNYPAREYGITRFHKLQDAKERCPELMIVHVATYKEGEAEPGYWDKVDSRTHKVSLDYYRRESVKVLNMFKEGLPGAEIEKASIDEAFIDFTKPVRQELLRRYPYLTSPPSDSPEGLDTPLPPPPAIDWGSFSNIIPVIAKDPEDLEHSKQYDDTAPNTWHDVGLSIAAEMMNKVRVAIAGTLGYTTSAGIARNKFLAKLAASYKKPYSQTILRNAAIPNYLKPLPFQKIRFLGGKLGEAIAKEYDVSTVGDLLPISLEEMQHKFGEEAIWVYEILRGIDRTEVKEKSAVNKSMLASKNLQKPITKASDGHHWIRVLAAELSLRLNDARKLNAHLWPKTLVLHARQGYDVSRSKQAPFPFSREVTVDIIATAGSKLWKELVGKDPGQMKVTSVQLAFTGIEVAEGGQQSIDGFFSGGQAPKRFRDDNDEESSLHGIVKGRRSEEDGNSAEKGEDFDTGATSFTCSTCRKRFSLSAMQIASGTADDHSRALKVMKVEHQDFHFAQTVAREIEPDPQPVQSGKTSMGVKKRRKEPAKGIEKFFGRK
ncbi:eta dna polymerase [Moniliophthora roreri MCA 2997]|uniref:DNA polymerase eta n=1 Tax=Moniliophthora roreri (strain MCA 2997) TaxID=1381753 RepID=V2WIC9_MONRO|nr:eta dna polymerase [Moniliophthora roreri MCA 2997]